jgi:hypothetical protein
MSWNTICIEGYCFGEEINGKYPCGRDAPTHLCLRNKHCPHFAWAETDEREVSIWVPFYKLFWDRLSQWSYTIYCKLRWWFWDSLPFNRRKIFQWFEDIRSNLVTDADSPALKEFEDGIKQDNEEFKIWFQEVKKEIENEKTI